jgi:hypothetical protein
MRIIAICAVDILSVSVFALPKRFGLKNKRINSSKEGNPFWSIGVTTILDFGIWIAD